MDLHAWITQQVDKAETAVRAGIEGRRVAFKPSDDGPVITGTITEVKQTPDGPQLVIAQYGVEPIGEGVTAVQPALAALLRCEADRRILTRHRPDPAAANTPRAAACDGCGVEWVQDYCDPITDNLNDCPELLDLAHAHGLTDEILAGLDRPQPPEPKPQSGNRISLGNTLTIRPITTSDVPEALRGPRWKP